MSRGRLLGAVVVLTALALLWCSYLPMEPARDLDPARSGPLRVVDRHGQLLRVVTSPARPGRADWVHLDQINATAVQALLASEDQGFFQHGGVDGYSVLRALWLDVKSGSLTYGASTLTMQLARMVYPAHIGHSLLGKLRQVRAAWAIERQLSKRQILEQYLNRAYFGRGAYGIEAAAHSYFQRSAASLSEAQAVLLMVLPRGPRLYDLRDHQQRALSRRGHLLRLLVAQGRLASDALDRIEREPLAIELQQTPFEASHFVDYVLAQVPEAERAHGGILETTLDLRLQRALEHRTREHLAKLRDKDADQAGLVVLDTQTGEIRAMIGSAKYGGAREGHINIATWRRYPGSALKPFVYAAAIERGNTPATLAYDVYDVPSAYVVKNMVPEEHGPARYREALAGSYNLAAVHVLEAVGIEPVMGLLKRAGVGELDLKPDDYGLRLSLGSTKVRLLDLASGYGAFVRGGTVVDSRAFTQLKRVDGTRLLPKVRDERRVLAPEVAWLVMDMLADPEARRPRFGQDLPFDLPYRVAAKTGTARGFSDTVAVVATREWTIAAWTGRFDGQSMQGLSGMRGAAELARAALVTASEGKALTLPAAPQGVARITVCPLSGKLAGPHCPQHKLDYALRDALPHERCDFHAADGHVHYPPELAGWLRRTGKLAAR